MEGIDAKDGVSNGLIYGNKVYNLPRLGIYIDAWDSLTEEIDVYNNIVYNCSEGIRANSENGGLIRNVQVYRNHAYNNTGCGYWVGVGGIGDSHPVDFIIFDSNIARGNGKDGIRISVPSGGSTDHIIIRNNLIYRNERAGIMVADFSRDDTGLIGEVEIINNTVYKNGTDNLWGVGGIMITSSPEGRRAIKRDPLFSNASGGDFHLRASSPCIDKGTIALSPTHGYEGTPRPQGAGVDIGAYESF